VLVIEHHLDVIKTADWIVDLGPEGGKHGGLVVTEGTPETVAACAQSYTGQFLRNVVGAYPDERRSPALVPSPPRPSLEWQPEVRDLRIPEIPV
jgi:excinuclease ABC subunit A